MGLCDRFDWVICLSWNFGYECLIVILLTEIPITVISSEHQTWIGAIGERWMCTKADPYKEQQWLPLVSFPLTPGAESQFKMAPSPLMFFYNLVLYTFTNMFGKNVTLIKQKIKFIFIQSIFFSEKTHVVNLIIFLDKIVRKYPHTKKNVRNRHKNILFG